MANHLVLKGSTWHVRLDVPEDVRMHKSFFMKKVLTKSLKTGDKKIAKIASMEILAIWKKQIESIRSGKELKPWLTDAENVRSQFLKDISTNNDTNKLQELIDSRNLEVARMAVQYSLSPTEIEEAKLIVRGELKPKHAISDSIITQFEDYQKKYNVIEKTASVQAANIRKYARFLEAHELTMNHDSFAKFLQSQTLSYKTLQNKIFAGSSFWKFLITKNPELRREENPFDNHQLPKPKKGKRISDSYEAFTVDDVEKLYHAASKKGDSTLAAVIKIGAYTGLRIEEICQLKITSISDGAIHISDAKTLAGIRTIPIPAALQSLINELSKTTKDEYLVPSSGGNKYGVRSDSISKRFGRLKTSMGYTSQKVFHSIRKTAATQLEQANVNPLTIMHILGHSRGTVTFDVYAKGPSMAQKKAALDCIKYNF